MTHELLYDVTGETDSNGQRALAARPVQQLQAFRWTLTPTSLTVPQDTSLSEATEMMAALDQMEVSVQWWRGDLWNFLDAKYGEYASQTAKDAVKDGTGRAYDTWVQSGRVAERFPFCDRSQNLTWKHHLELTPMAAEDKPLALRWLRHAAEESWSAARLKRELERAERLGTPPWEELPEPQALPESSDLEILDGDFWDALAYLPDDSIDAIITDPPYPEEHLPLYSKLAALAARVLKPGAPLLAMSGQTHLPEVLQLMVPHLDYYWCLDYRTAGQAPKLWHRQVNTNWKPVLWFVKGGVYDGETVSDVVESLANDKQHHAWGQSESGFEALVERFTRPGALVLDPFLGGGTTAIAARRLGRRFLGVEVDPEAAAVARRRLASLIEESA